MEEAFDSFLKLAEDRYSVRKFSDKPVEQYKIDSILRAGQVAPTARNQQPQRILVITDAGQLDKLRGCTRSLFGCTLAMLICCDTQACWRRACDDKSSGDIDAAIVTTHMMLEAHALGIGSTWVMHFVPDAIRSAFALPDSYEPVSLLVMGYAAADAEPYPMHFENKDLSETVWYDRFDG